MRWYAVIRRAHRLSTSGAVLLGLMTSGCFGDWVSARPRPTHDEEAASPKVDLGVPADACTTYVAAVAERCEAVLEGSLGHCHRELVRVMALAREGEASLEPARRSPAPDDPGAPSRRAEWRAERCAEHLRALPEAPRRGTALELGPECQAWARVLRERCVAPLSTPTRDLRGCGADLLAFESILGAMTFGSPQVHEPTCRDAVRRPTAP